MRTDVPVDGVVDRLDRRFRVLVSAYAVSAYGNYLSLIALSLFTYEVTESATGLGLLMALRLLSGVAAGVGPWALATRFNRRTVMMCADVVQALAMSVLVLYAESMSVLLLAGVVVALGSGNTWFTVALRSAVPVMVGHAQRGRANGLLVTARSVATVLGFASAAPIIALGGYRVAFAVNAASFLVSAAAVLVLRPRTDAEDPDEPAAGTASAGKPTAETPTAETPTAATSDARSRARRGLAGLPALLFGMILLRGIDALASSSHNVALPVVAGDSSPSNPAAFMTQFWAAWAVGTLLAHQVVKRWNSGAGNPWGERAFAVGTCVMSTFFVLAFTGLPAPALVAVAVVAGLADGFTEIVYTSRLQAVPDRQRSRLFGLSAAAEQSGFTLGMLAAAMALETLPAMAVVGAFHGVAVCGALAFLVFRMRHKRGEGAPAQPAQNEETQENHGKRGEESHEARTGESPLPRS